MAHFGASLPPLSPGQALFVLVLGAAGAALAFLVPAAPAPPCRRAGCGSRSLLPVGDGRGGGGCRGGAGCRSSHTRNPMTVATSSATTKTSRPATNAAQMAVRDMTSSFDNETPPDEGGAAVVVLPCSPRSQGDLGVSESPRSRKVTTFRAGDVRRRGLGQVRGPTASAVRRPTGRPGRSWRG